MKRDELEASLKGHTHADVAALAAAHFTPEFMERTATGLFRSAQMVQGVGGMRITYNPSELDKCFVHHSARELLDNLWGAATPALKQFLGPDSRFDLDGAFPRPLGGNLRANLDAGREFIVDTTRKIHDDWLDALPVTRDDEGRLPLLTIMYMGYKGYTVLIRGGDWDRPTGIEGTFTSSTLALFDWLRDYPDFTRVELERIVRGSVRSLTRKANGMAIESSTREEVTSRARKRGELAYVFDPISRLIVFNPDLDQEVADLEASLKGDYYDQTDLRLTCPAKYVRSTLYPNGSVIQDLTRFKASVYTEVYLATHDRR